MRSLPSRAAPVNGCARSRRICGMRFGSALVLAFALVTGACTSEVAGQAPPSGAAQDGTPSGEATATAAQQAALSESAEAVVAVDHAVMIADAVFNVDRLDFDSVTSDRKVGGGDLGE